MGAPSRQHFEFKLNLNVVGKSRRASLPDGLRYRIDKEIRRRAEMMGLRVFYLKLDSARIELDALVQPNMNKSNIERGLWGAITGILRKEMPHMVKRTGQKGQSPFASGGFY